MDHGIRIFHLSHSVHSSFSEHQESTKSANYYTKRGKNKSILNSHWGKNGIMETRTKIWWNEQEKKSFFNMPICRSKYSISLGLIFQFSFCPALSDYLPSGRSRHVWAISTAIFSETNPHNNLPVNRDFVISEVMQSRHRSRHQTGYWLQTMWVGRMGTKQPEWNRMNFQTSPIW